MDRRIALCAIAATVGATPQAASANQLGPQPLAQARALATIHSRVELKAGQVRIDHQSVAAMQIGHSGKARSVDEEGQLIGRDVPTPGRTLIVIDLP
jgi:Cu/Ag efflux protein CusF